jgi:hypothetical protein
VSRASLIVAAAAVALALGAGAADARTADSSVSIVFHLNHSVTATLADGRALGTTSGAPTVIAPGQYNLSFDDSAGVEGPSFDLVGPGVKFFTDMFYGENPSETYALEFLPSSTYTWRNDEQPAVVFTFTTAASGGATSPGAGGLSSGSGGTSSGGAKTSSSSDLVGSARVPFRGALDAIVSAAGKLTLARNGKKVTSLKTGRWTFSVDDESKTAGFSVQSLKGKPQTITTKAYVGSHDVTVELKPGRWSFFTPSGKRTTFFVVS